MYVCTPQVLIGFDSNEVAGACVSDIIKAGVLPVAIEFMDRPCIVACEAFAKAGYPDCEALLIVEVEGSDAEIDEQLETIIEIARAHDPVELRQSNSADSAHQRALWRDARMGFLPTNTFTGFVCN